MLSGEWKLWLEAALGKIRGLDVISRTERDSGSATLGTLWTEVWSVPAVSTETSGSLSICLNGLTCELEQVVLLMHMDSSSFTDETGKTVTKYDSITTASGVFGSAAFFDGGAKVLHIEDTSEGGEDFYLNGEQFTIEFWFKMANASQGGYIIFCNNAWQVSFDGPTDKIIYGTYRVPGSYWEYRTATSCGLSTAYYRHVAITHDGVKLRIFVNGVELLEGDSPGATTATSSEIWLGNTGSHGIGAKNFYMDELFVIKGKALYTEDFTPPASPHSIGGANPQTAELRVLVNGSVRESVEVPAIARHFFEVGSLAPGDVISLEALLDVGGDIDWYGVYEASSAGVETSHGLRYPAPEYDNDDPRWIGRWTDIYKMLIAAEPRTSGKQKNVGGDEQASDSYSYVASTTTTICEVSVETGSCTVRVECFARSLFTGFELHKNGAKIADLSIFSQKGQPCWLTSSTLCHDIVFSDVAAGTNTFALKGVSTATESGHMEAQLHVIY